VYSVSFTLITIVCGSYVVWSDLIPRHHMDLTGLGWIAQNAWVGSAFALALAGLVLAIYYYRCIFRSWH